MHESLRKHDEEMLVLQAAEKEPTTDAEIYQAVIDHINERLLDMPDDKDISWTSEWLVNRKVTVVSYRVSTEDENQMFEMEWIDA